MNARRAEFVKLLTPLDYERWEAFMREPARSVDQVHDWLQAECGLVDSKDFPEHPRRCSRSSVHKELSKFRETDALRAATEMADAIHTANAEGGAVDISAAVNLQLAQRLQSLLVNAREAGIELDMDALLKAARAINNLGQAQQRIVELKRVGREQLDALKGAATQGRAITAEMIDAASKAVFG